MRVLVLVAAGIVLAGAAIADAQALRGPRELPPPGFSGQQFTDSAGCVFLRAGVSGRTTWVARVGSNRRQLCGYPPSFQAPPPVAVAEVPAPAPAPAAGTKAPVATVATTTKPPAVRASTPRASVPASSYAPPPVAAAAAAPTPTAGCPAASPYGTRVMLADGRRALACVASPDRLEAYAARVVARSAPAAVAAEPAVQMADGDTSEATPIGASGIGPRVACPPDTPTLRAYDTRDGQRVFICAPPGAEAVPGVSSPVARSAAAPIAVASAGVQVPKGYRLAWKDDRLNPLRGKGTAAGQVAQDQVWTRKVPADLVAGATHPYVVTSAGNLAPQRATATVSTSGTPRAPKLAGTARLYVQVGSFGQPANADRARGRLAGLGLPVAGGKASIKGKAVQVVYAGPFGTASDAQAALAAARRAGFGDAFIR